jgi:surface antigen/transposase-like protein
MIIAMVMAANMPATAAISAASASEQDHVDKATAFRVASELAIAANLSVAANIANQSTSLDAQAQMVQSDQESIDKPTLIRTASYNREITTYMTQQGDTVGTIAKQHNISAQTIKWTNNLTADTLDAGTSLTILPVDGVLYTVKENDTVESISKKYTVDIQRIVSFNDLELSGVKNGQRIILPGGILPEEERPGYTAPVAPSALRSASTAPVSNPIVNTSAGNAYAFGNCTAWAYERRMQLGRPIGSFWGNATTWDIFARQAGFSVNKTPAPGAILQMKAFVDAYTGGYGHVAIVESVNSDGSVNISEMNYAGNFNRVTYRTIPAAQAAIYNYIH